MISTIEQQTTTSSSDVRQIGQVKWFNNKAGYGFITVSDGSNKGKDIFAHYSTISVGDTQYKYLVQGEYVEFDLIPSTNESHEFQSVNITGIKGGHLMCETRQSNRPRIYAPSADEPRSTSRTYSRPRRNDDRPSSNVESADGFQPVQKKRQSTRSSN
jgi:hypothetical protein